MGWVVLANEEIELSGYYCYDDNGLEMNVSGLWIILNQKFLSSLQKIPNILKNHSSKN